MFWLKLADNRVIICYLQPEQVAAAGRAQRCCMVLPTALEMPDDAALAAHQPSAPGRHGGNRASRPAPLARLPP